MGRFASLLRLPLPKVPEFGNILGVLLKRNKVATNRVPEVCEAVRTHLSDAMPDLEAAFLSIGEKLEKMDECSRNLTGECSNLLKLAGGSEEGTVLLRDSLTVLHAPLEYIDFCMSEHERLLGLLEQCESQTKGMLSIGSRMHDAIAPLTFMSVLFKIESAYLPVDMRETFVTVTTEVERLHRLVDETFAQNAQQLEMAYRTLSSVRAHLAEDFRKQTRIIGEKRKRIDSAVLTLDEQISHNSERDSQLHSYSGSLSEEVAKVVVGVQFYDIVRQKCEHVAEGLVAKNGVVSGHQVKLQIHQLQTVEADFDHGFNSMSGGLGRIKDLTDRLNESSVSLESFQSMTAAVDGMVQSLLDALSDVHEIIGMIHDLAEQGNTAVQPANGIARNLTTAINELSINMRLIALNAQVRSVQGGQGTGLELLAARTAEISDQINDISTQVSDDLSHLHSAIDEMLGTFAKFLDRGKEQNRLLTESRGDAEQRLHNLRDRALQAVQMIGISAEKVQSSVEDARGALEFLPALRSRFGRASELLREIEPSASATEHDAAHLSSLADRYTMASERKVHETLVASITKDPGKIRAESASSGSQELFDEQPAAPVPSQPPTSAPGANDNVELF